MTANLPINKIIVLMYHRITTADADPWGICVSPTHFEQQLQVLKNHFTIISSAEVVQQVLNGNIKQNAVCLTFDDGYADNYVHAKPLLEKYNCPATFFIATGLTGSQQPFWWDELSEIFLRTTVLPEYLSIKTGTAIFVHHLSEPVLSAEMLKAHKTWKYHGAAPTDRCSLYLALWERLMVLTFKQINAVMDALRIWSAVSTNKDPLGFAMTELQLHNLSASKLFSLGMHTRTHPDLSVKSRLSQLNEIAASKTALENYKGYSNIFSYPYGRYNNATPTLLNELGIPAAFTTEQKAVLANTHLHKLGRFQVFDWKGRVFANHISKWML